MKIFVSASWQDKEIAKELMDALEKHGHEITERWYTHLEKEKYKSFAEEDVEGVKKCDTYIMYNGGVTTAGKYVEMGIAIAWKKRIITVGRKLTTVFRAFVDIHLPTKVLFDNTIKDILGVL